MEENNHGCINREDLLKKTRENIEKYGLQVLMVKSTNYLPSFGYSIGLWENYKHPEIICFGLPNNLLHEIINDVAEIIKTEGNFVANTDYQNIFENSRSTFLEVEEDNIKHYFNVALEYYKEEKFPAYQLIWTDRNDKYPWEEGFEQEFIYDQPLLDRNSDFKFREPRNLTTYTTRQWLENNKPILTVAHDEDGDWQFLTDDDLSTEDMRIVALEQIILRDNSLNEVFDLEYGEEAERKFVGGKWLRNRI